MFSSGAPLQSIANTTNQVALRWGKQLKFELRERTLLALTGPRTTAENPNWRECFAPCHTNQGVMFPCNLMPMTGKLRLKLDHPFDSKLTYSVNDKLALSGQNPEPQGTEVFKIKDKIFLPSSTSKPAHTSPKPLSENKTYNSDIQSCYPG